MLLRREGKAALADPLSDVVDVVDVEARAPYGATVVAVVAVLPAELLAAAGAAATAGVPAATARGAFVTP